MYEVVYTPHPNLYVMGQLLKQLNRRPWVSNLLLCPESDKPQWREGFEDYLTCMNEFRPTPRMSVYSWWQALDQDFGRWTVRNIVVSGMLFILCSPEDWAQYGPILDGYWHTLYCGSGYERPGFDPSPGYMEVVHVAR